jgi:hypothetical protein
VPLQVGISPKSLNQKGAPLARLFVFPDTREASLAKAIFPFSTLTDTLGDLLFPNSARSTESRSANFLAYLRGREADTLRSVIVEAARHADGDLAAALVFTAGLFQILRKYVAGDAIEAAQRRLLRQALKARLRNLSGRISARRSAALFRDVQKIAMRINFDQDLTALIRHRRGDSLLLFVIASNLAEQIHWPDASDDSARPEESEADAQRRRALRTIVAHYWRTLTVEAVIEKLTGRPSVEGQEEDAAPVPPERGTTSIASAALQRAKLRRMSQPSARTPLEREETLPRYEPGITAASNRLERIVLFEGMPLHSPKDEAGAMINQYRALMKPIPLISRKEPREIGDRLREGFPWMANAITQVENALILAKRLGAEHFQLSPILLSGPSGVGKTAFAAGIAEAAGVVAHSFQAAASADAYHFQGSPPSFRGASPSFILRQIFLKRIANPVVIVDELDKAASNNEQHGRIVDALLAMLEPLTARAWPDPFLSTPADISAVTWIVAVNEPERLPATLRSRLKHIPVRPPTAVHAEHLIQMMLLELVKGDVQALERLPAIEPLARKELADDLERHGDIRRLKRAVLAAVSAGDWPSVH